MPSGDGSVRRGPVVGEIERAHLPEGLGSSRRDVILDAVVEVVAERGVAGASVGLVCARAKLSRRTFHECFDGLDQCLMAILDRALAHAVPLVARAFAVEGYWQDGMRLALAAMLELFDEDPALARVCLVELQTAGLIVRDHRERTLEAFRALILARVGGELSHASPLAAEGAHASVIGIVSARLIAREQRPLIELLGSLMGIIAGPFMDEALIAREVERGNQLARELLAARASRPPASESTSAGVSIPVALQAPGAYRARLCLLYVASYPGCSNSEVADGIGVSHRGQVSTLLARLAGLGLLVKRSGGPGLTNAWSLSAAGEQVALALTEQQ